MLQTHAAILNPKVSLLLKPYARLWYSAEQILASASWCPTFSLCSPFYFPSLPRWLSPFLLRNVNCVVDKWWVTMWEDKSAKSPSLSPPLLAGVFALPSCSHMYTYTDRLLALGGEHPFLNSLQHLFQPHACLFSHSMRVTWSSCTATHEHTDSSLSS